jgi:hypothetical protein
METYTLPREAFDILQDSLGGKQKAEVLARTLETVINSIQQRAKEDILEQNLKNRRAQVRLHYHRPAPVGLHLFDQRELLCA